MRVYFGLAIAAVLCLAGAVRAEPLELEQIAADAKWVAHLDVDAMRTSAVADKVREHWREKHPKAVEHLEMIRAVWNFNPCADVHGITLYGTKIKKDTGVVIVHAKVDQEFLLDKARKAPGHRGETYGQYRLHTWRHREGKKHERDMTGVFYRPDVILFGGSIDEVKTALDVLDGTSPNLAGKKSPLTVPVAEGTMFLARAVDLAEAKDLPCKSPMVKQIDSIALAIGEKGGDSFLVARMCVKKPELARQIKTVVEGARAMAAMVNGDDSEALELIDALDIDIKGKVIEVEWRAPAEKVWNHLKKMKEIKKAHRTGTA
ncbi:MAG: hypothetical protein JW959_00970 [Pirellulales bacterium]|nr:hypothetical protein [Pirellulales bacterium]